MSPFWQRIFNVLTKLCLSIKYLTISRNTIKVCVGKLNTSIVEQRKIIICVHPAFASFSRD